MNLFNLYNYYYYYYRDAGPVQGGKQEEERTAVST